MGRQDLEPYYYYLARKRSRTFNSTVTHVLVPCKAHYLDEPERIELEMEIKTDGTRWRFLTLWRVARSMLMHGVDRLGLTKLDDQDGHGHGRFLVRPSANPSVRIWPGVYTRPPRPRPANPPDFEPVQNDNKVKRKKGVNILPPTATLMEAPIRPPRQANRPVGAAGPGADPLPAAPPPPPAPPLPRRLAERFLVEDASDSDLGSSQGTDEEEWVPLPPRPPPPPPPAPPLPEVSTPSAASASASAHHGGQAAALHCFGSYHYIFQSGHTEVIFPLKGTSHI